MINNSYSTAKPTITNDATNNQFTVAGATGTKLWYTVDGSDPLMSDTATKATGNTANVPFANLSGGGLRAIAVPTNTAKFASDEAVPTT